LEVTAWQQGLVLSLLKGHTEVSVLIQDAFSQAIPSESHVIEKGMAYWRQLESGSPLSYRDAFQAYTETSFDNGTYHPPTSSSVEPQTEHKAKRAKVSL